MKSCTAETDCNLPNIYCGYPDCERGRANKKTKPVSHSTEMENIERIISEEKNRTVPFAFPTWEERAARRIEQHIDALEQNKKNIDEVTRAVNIAKSNIILELQAERDRLLSLWKPIEDAVKKELLLGSMPALLDAKEGSGAYRLAHLITQWHEAVKERDKLREALKPFVDVAKNIEAEAPDNGATEVVREMTPEEDAKVRSMLGLPLTVSPKRRTSQIYSLDGLQVKHWRTLVALEKENIKK